MQAREKSLELQDLHERNQEECGEIEARILSHRTTVRRLDERHAVDSEAIAIEIETLTQVYFFSLRF